MKSHSLDSLQSRIRGVVERKGKIELLQLSGGEPTLHPQFFELVDWIHAEPGIDYCLVNTNGATIGYQLRTPLGVRSISEFIDFASVQGFLRDKVRYDLADLIQCGCENTELGEVLHRFEMKEKDAFRLFIKPFMDAWTWDQDRIDRCCTHVIRPDGMLDSFCRYYATGGGK